MSYGINAKPNIPNTGAVSTTTVNTQASAPINVPVGQGSSVDNSQVSVNQNNNQSQPQTKRSRQQLLDSLKFLQNYGITQEEGVEILCAMGFNSSEQTLLNLEQKDLNNQIKIIMDTITALQEDKIEVNKENLAKHASRYASQINCGWDSVASFRKANKRNDDSLLERLKNAFGKDYSNASEEELVKAVERYCLEISNTDITDFSKLLYNSSDKEIQILYKAIPYFDCNDRLKGIVAAIKSCSTAEAQSKLVSNYEDNKRIMTAIDKNGNSMSQEQMTELSAGLASYRKQEDAIEYNKETVKDIKEFFAQKDIQEKIKKILVKYENKEALTQEEQELLNLYNSIIAEPTGQFIGYSNSNVLSKDEKFSVISDLNKGIYETPVYRKIMQSVNEYVKTHQNALAMSPDDFVKLMDEVTSGNYTTVVNDVANGTVTELTQPQEANSSATNASSTEVVTQPDFGVERREVPVNTKTSVTELYQEQTPIVNTHRTSNVEDTPVLSTTKQDIVSITRAGGIKAFCNFVKNNGASQAVVEVYNNFNKINQAVKSYAEKMYNMLNHSRQELVLRSVASSSVSGFNELLAQTSDQVVLNLGDNFTSFYTKQQVEKAKEKAQEKQQIGLG